MSRRWWVAAAAAFAALVVGVVVVQAPGARGEPTARDAVLAYLDALARRDRADLHATFAGRSSARQIDERLRIYGGEPARSATFVILQPEPGVRGVPRGVEFTFPTLSGPPRRDKVAVWEHDDGKWLMLIEDPVPFTCEPGAVCDASPTPVR